MIEIVEQIFGPYTIPEGMNCNVPYLVGVGLFALVLYCGFRLIGVAIGGRR